MQLLRNIKLHDVLSINILVKRQNEKLAQLMEEKLASMRNKEKDESKIINKELLKNKIIQLKKSFEISRENCELSKGSNKKSMFKMPNETLRNNKQRFIRNSKNVKNVNLIKVLYE